VPTLDAQAKKRLLRSVVAEVKINEDKDRLPEIRLLEPWATLLEPVTGDTAAPGTLSETAEPHWNLTRSAHCRGGCEPDT